MTSLLFWQIVGIESIILPNVNKIEYNTGAVYMHPLSVYCIPQIFTFLHLEYC